MASGKYAGVLGLNQQSLLPSVDFGTARRVCVSTYIRDNTPGTPPVSMTAVLPRMRIAYGEGRAIAEVVADFCPTLFSITTRTLTIYVYADIETAIGTPPAFPTIESGCIVAPGNSENLLTFTEPMAEYVVATPLRMVPERAKYVRVMNDGVPGNQSAGAPPNARLIFYDDGSGLGGGPNVSIGVVDLADAMQSRYPVPRASPRNQTCQYQMLADAAYAGAYFRVQFELEPM